MAMVNLAYKNRLRTNTAREAREAIVDPGRQSPGVDEQAVGFAILKKTQQALLPQLHLAHLVSHLV